MDILNPRETATGIWMVIGLVALLWGNGTRESAEGLVKFVAFLTLQVGMQVSFDEQPGQAANNNGNNGG